ncbi:MAG: caspase family protein [Rhodoferax sp.]|nr:caspase family protein [Rhodoferax sp.]
MNNFPAPSSAPAPISAAPKAAAPKAAESTAAAPAITAALPGGETQAPLPLPKLIVDATKSLPKLAGVLKQPELQAINQQVHEARTKLFAGALDMLEKDPKAADVADCVEGSTDLCIAQVPAPTAAYLPVVKRRFALLIGNNAYRSPVPELETAINDVTAIGAELRDKLGYEVKVVQNAGRKDMVDALNDLIRTTGKDDSVVIMYAGHGYLDDKTKAGYWIPLDATTTNPDKWVSNDTIARALRNIPAKQVMLVSDSCYSGSLTKEGKQISTVAISREQTLTRRSVLAFSSGGEEPVTDDGHDQHSIFAWNMIESLKSMKTETSGQQLHASIKAAVAEEYPQVPQYGTVNSAGHAEGGEYLLTPKKEGVY